jgi:hypothetical protein
LAVHQEKGCPFEHFPQSGFTIGHAFPECWQLLLQMAKHVFVLKMKLTFPLIIIPCAADNLFQSCVGAFSGILVVIGDFFLPFRSLVRTMVNQMVANIGPINSCEKKRECHKSPNKFILMTFEIFIFNTVTFKIFYF